MTEHKKTASADAAKSARKLQPRTAPEADAVIKPEAASEAAPVAEPVAEPVVPAVAPVEAQAVEPKPAKAAKVVKAAKPVKAGKPAKEPKALRPKKVKLVRDSYAMPEAEYARIGELKKRLAAQGRETRKSELLRGGIAALAALNDAELLAVMVGVERIKTGRPAK